jgi:hypothetical protein
MRVNVRVLFMTDNPRGLPMQVETAVWKDIKMPFPPVVGLELLVGEDDIPIDQVVFDHRKQRYRAYCQYSSPTKEGIEKAVKHFVRHGWTHDPH